MSAHWTLVRNTFKTRKPSEGIPRDPAIILLGYGFVSLVET